MKIVIIGLVTTVLGAGCALQPAGNDDEQVTATSPVLAGSAPASALSGGVRGNAGPTEAIAPSPLPWTDPSASSATDEPSETAQGPGGGDPVQPGPPRGSRQ